MGFLPINREEMLERGWEQPDFIYICGDAYVDHPSFGAAIITRMLEAHGYKVVFLAQPDWKKNDEFLQFGEPRLGFLISSGNIDSMVNHYSVSKRRRDKDSYTDEGVMGKRPDRATIVYSKKVRSLFPDSAIILGGIEASLRRLAHYDYWDDKVRPSILLDAMADMVLYGMGENSIIELAEALDGGLNIKDITYIKGSVYQTNNIDTLFEHEILPTFEEIKTNKRMYARSFKMQHENHDALNATTLVEPYKNCYVVQNPPSLPLTTDEMDYSYSLPYMRKFHPRYKYIPAIEEVKFSVISNRGCFGSCSFCALTAHQGRIIQSRSKDSIVKEVKRITEYDDFKGYIHDVGGPTANFYHPSCDKQLKVGTCKHRECLHPKPCPNLKVDHSDYLEILRACRSLPKIKKVFVRSGIRYDYLMHDKDDTFFKELIEHHISGQLKVAPEHVSNKVLDIMGKCNFELYDSFTKKYERLNEEANKNQFLVPYLMSSHPGCDLHDAVELACYLKRIHHTPQQVQDFYPTPSTLSTCMYYTGIDPLTDKPIYVEKDPHEKLLQRALMQYSYPKNYDLVYEALKKANRLDLVGNSKKCLIPPISNVKHYDNRRNQHGKNRKSFSDTRSR
ncbi:YgiQ family radical SAM protein [Anaerorhabdus sp.]|uniref:YgiQ family radical SAM protein n=1 Tax=Anaerorhabdus sp. TaxID=1872524 RepID=UPI002FC7C5B7